MVSQMPEQRRFTLYNNGESGVLLGYGERIVAGEYVRSGPRLYIVEEVRKAPGTLWTASLKAADTEIGR